MENRERDRVSQRTSSTEAGEVNRSAEERKGREQNSGTSAEFGQNIGRSENLEGGTMDNNRTNRDRDKSIGSESSRRPEGDLNSSTGRSGSIGNMGGGGSEINEDTGRRGSTGSVENSGNRERSRSSGDSSEGRH